MLLIACIIAMLLLVVFHIQRAAERKQIRPALFKPKYAGMSTRERLCAAGIAKEFEAAVQDRDIESMVTILLQTEVAYPESRAIAEAIAEDPEKHKL